MTLNLQDLFGTLKKATRGKYLKRFLEVARVLSLKSIRNGLMISVKVRPEDVLSAVKKMANLIKEAVYGNR